MKMSVERELVRCPAACALEREMAETRETLKQLHELALQARAAGKPYVGCRLCGLIGALGAKIAMVVGFLPR